MSVLVEPVANKPSTGPNLAAANPRGSPLEVLFVFLRLGLTSFGGPVAHLGYFRTEFVVRRRWVDEATFADLVALSQLLPGPISSQVGMSLGLLRAGHLGLLFAWVGFTLPSAMLMLMFAYGINALGDVEHASWLKGLKLVAVAVLAQAVWGMARSLCPDRERAALAVAASLIVLAEPSSAGQVSAIGLGAVAGIILPSPPGAGNSPVDGPRPIIELHRGVGIATITAFVILLLGLPGLESVTNNHAVALLASFFQTGALTFGGGHMILPLLQFAVVPPGWVSNDAFLAGYGAAQAIPGPLASFATYLGAVMEPTPNGWVGGILCLVAIFLPSMLLVTGVLPFMETLRHRHTVQAALRGINAAVVGLLLATLYTPVWTSTVKTSGGFGLALTAFLLLTVWAVRPWVIVVLGAFTAMGLAALHVPL